MTPVPKEILTQHVAVLGKTRSGKSSVMRGLVESLLDRELPVCIVDPKGDWWGIKLGADGKRAGYPVVIFGGEHADIPINEHAGAHVAELFATGNRPCLIDLGGWMPGARTQFWIDFASTLFRFTKGNRWLAVDEVHNFAPKGKVMDPQAGKALHWTNRLASEGLGKGLAMIFASQRPQKVHNDTLTSAETLIAMRVLHPSDRGAVADWIKGCGDSEGSEVLNSLAQMERGEGWVWSPEIGFGPKRVKFPMFKTYDSFRPQSVEDTKKLKGWAEVDLDDVRLKMAATIEKAKADDPRELRKQIAELKKDLSKAGQIVPARTKTVDKPVLTDADRALLEKVHKRLDDIGSVLLDGTTVIADRLAGFVRDEAQKALTAVEAKHVTTRERYVALIESKGFQKILAKLATHNSQLTTQMPHRQAERTTPARHQERPAGAGSPGGSRVGARPAVDMGDLTGPEFKILTSLAELEVLGLHPAEKRQLGLMAGYTNVRSGGFSEPLGRLVAGGLIASPRAGIVAITDEGRAHAGAVQAPSSAEELQDRILAHLTSPEQKLLRTLIEQYPKPITKEELGAICGYTNIRSGGFSEPLGRLSTLGLVVSPQRGVVAAAPVLFLEAA